jgi:hypothetical protein
VDRLPLHRNGYGGSRGETAILLPSIPRNAGLFAKIGGFRGRLFCAIVPDRCYGETVHCETGRMEEMLG